MATQGRGGQPGNYNSIPGARIDGDPSGFEFDQLGNAFLSLGSSLSVLLSNVENDTVGAAPYRRIDSFQSVPTDTQSTSVQTVKIATTAKTIYVTDLTISTDGGAVCNVIVQDDAGSPINIEKVFLPATATSLTFRYYTPKVTTSGQALKYVCSSATPHISVSASGYVI